MCTATDYGHPMRAFFQISKIFWLIGQTGRISCEVFQDILGSTYLLKFCHCVSLVCIFSLLKHYLCKKLRFSYILQDFLFGIGIGTVENFRSSQHASVVRGIPEGTLGVQRSKKKIKELKFAVKIANISNDYQVNLKGVLVKTPSVRQ